MIKNYKEKYFKYKNKYMNLKGVAGGEWPDTKWPPSYDTVSFTSDIGMARAEANKAAYGLLIKMNQAKKSDPLQVATIESLTGGLIFSTLVDIPFGGEFKYGCFGVYDTDAKRIFAGVSVSDVYTHKCAKQMAVGLLKNSNATLAISVTGNSMPHAGNETSLGKVHIGIAGYKIINGKVSIIVTTKLYDFCKDLDTCELWKNAPEDKKILIKKLLEDKQLDLSEYVKSLRLNNRIVSNYNDLQLTSMISIYIRNKTACAALKYATEFITNDLIIPEFVKQNKIYYYDKITDKYIDKSNKLSFDQSNNSKLIYPSLDIICISSDCDDEGMTMSI